MKLYIDAITHILGEAQSHTEASCISDSPTVRLPIGCVLHNGKRTQQQVHLYGDGINLLGKQNASKETQNPTGS
jgi:hypothetical protein